MAIHCMPDGDGHWTVDDAGVDLGDVDQGQDGFHWTCTECRATGVRPENKIRASLDLQQHWVMTHREKLLAGG